MSLQRVRDILSIADGRRASRRSTVMSALMALYFALFVCDTLNLDVIYASMFGKINFVDESSISDSLFDVGPSHHQSVFSQHQRANHHLKFSASAADLSTDDGLGHNSVYEDEDSPGVQDASTSASLSTEILVTRPPSELRVLTPTISFDRIITFQQILI